MYTNSHQTLVRLLVWGASTPQHSQMCEDGPPCKVSEKAFGPQCWKLKVRPLWLKCQSQGNTGRVEFLILAPNLFLLHEVNEWTLTTLLLDTKLTQTYSAPSLHSHTHTHTYHSHTAFVCEESALMKDIFTLQKYSLRDNIMHSYSSKSSSYPRNPRWLPRL